MSGCEYFEDHFNTWHSGELNAEESAKMQSHAVACPYCRAIEMDTINIRSMVGSLSKLEPSPRFSYQLEHRLANAINEKSNRRADRKSILPGWIPLGAGIATGLAVGVVSLFVFFNYGQNQGSRVPALASKDAGQAAVSDTFLVGHDSLAKSDRSFDLGNFSQTVSSEK